MTKKKYRRYSPEFNLVSVNDSCHGGIWDSPDEAAQRTWQE
jgi:hypothetical protein